MVLFLLVNNIIYPNIVQAASKADRYPYNYSIEDLLTYFQYVTKEDCTLVTHTVGPVAVGGTLTAPGITVGDGAVTPSYAYKMNGVALPSDQDQNDYDGSCDDFYFATSDLANNQLGGFTKNAEYMSLSANFDKIISESESLKANSHVVELEDGTVNGSRVKLLTCNLDQYSSFTINYQDLYTASTINLVINNPEDIKDNKYVINIVGLNEIDELKINASQSSGIYSNSDYIGVRCNGNAAYFIKNLLGSIADGQVNKKGMKLIFNFPDMVGTIRAIGHGGHIVAPKATVIPSAGTLEGGIIAKSIFTSRTGDESAEVHYYPYNTPTPSSNTGSGDDPEQVTCDDIELIKKYVEALGGDTVSTDQLPASGAKFTLFKDGNAILGNIEPQKLSDGEFRVIILGENLTPNTEYVLKETTPAVGFELNSTEYYCKLDENGDVWYKIGQDGYGKIVPTCENVKSVTQETYHYLWS